MKLYIGYKNYSSWSLRVWLPMKVAGFEFEEQILQYAHSNQLIEVADQLNVPPQVPILLHDGQTIWDSMAILEYLNEAFPEKHLWPEDPSHRAWARSTANEMHTGFLAIRNQFPMNIRAMKNVNPSDSVQAELQRFAVLWAQAHDLGAQGDFLCGDFGIVDAMYAPVLHRVRGYGLKVSPLFAQWTEAMLALPAMQEWMAAAEVEEWQIAKYDLAGEILA